VRVVEGVSGGARDVRLHARALPVRAGDGVDGAANGDGGFQVWVHGPALARMCAAAGALADDYGAAELLEVVRQLLSGRDRDPPWWVLILSRVFSISHRWTYSAASDVADATLGSPTAAETHQQMLLLNVNEARRQLVPGPATVSSDAEPSSPVDAGNGHGQ